MRKSKIPVPLKTIRAIPYGWRIALFDDRKAFNEYVKATVPPKHHEEMCVSMDRGPSGRTVTSTTERLAIVGLFANAAGECSAPGTIAHEMLHVVTAIFDHVGVPISAEADEAMAYLLGYLVEEAWAPLTRNYNITLSKARIRSRRK